MRAAFAPAEGPSSDTVAVDPPLNLEGSTLWLARAIYSETKLPHEQELVAWVVRNRVETAYRGRRTYRAVVLDPYQFSAFNPGAAKRARYLRLQPEAPLPRWRQALWVARYVRHAEGRAYRPFPVETRHFYSERSMRGRAVPYWAERGGFVAPDPGRYAVDERRFRFFKQIS
ncbi:cell wall hydrolase [Salinibacter ruber]|uniref:cell wall hydrolase n=1 Tax=Salinibacter ruber TaxID=146919 RepID=UPI00243431D7|nr:cell wall hydrolase [Salinibacter ruber]